jgi:hypothetical protein
MNRFEEKRLNIYYINKKPSPKIQNNWSLNKANIISREYKIKI